MTTKQKAPAIAIQQMFEDIPNTSYSTMTQQPQQNQSNDTKKTLETPKSRVKSSVAKKSTSQLTAGYSRAASVIEASSSKEVNSRTASNSVSMRGKSLGVGVPGHSSRANRMSSATAMSMYSEKLTPYECKEIESYPYVYFLGSEAKKIYSDSVGKNASTYDDEDQFYRVVPGDHIAYRYEVADKPNLGKGTFGQAIKVYDHKEQRWVCLKLIRNEKIYLNQSKEELRILQVLRKQDTNGLYNVVKLLDHFMFRNHMVFSFELLGMNLYQVLKRNNYRGLTTPKILPIARGIVKCLELLFKNRIVHCDIKPENIMLRKNGDITSIKVGDFGSSCYEQQQKYHYIQSRYYRAPEVLLGMRYGPAIDMWSFGCVLGELATGSPLLMGENADDQLAAVSEAIGQMPPSMLNKGKNSSKIQNRAGRGGPGTKPLGEVLGGDEEFRDCVKKILKWDPDVRPTPQEIQLHPWLMSSFSRRSSASAARTRKSSASSAYGRRPQELLNHQSTSSSYKLSQSHHSLATSSSKKVVKTQDSHG